MKRLSLWLYRQAHRFMVWAMNRGGRFKAKASAYIPAGTLLVLAEDGKTIRPYNGARNRHFDVVGVAVHDAGKGDKLSIRPSHTQSSGAWWTEE